MSLTEKLATRIEEAGSISVADYMEAALIDPDHGYYTTATPFGSDGDFTTAPEVSQIFGELVGAWIANQWMQSTSPRGILLELGPGRGTMMADLLRATQGIPGFHEAMDIELLECSINLRAVQKKKLTELHPRIRWCDTLEELPSRPLFFIANEFFDALPIQQFISNTEERTVSYDRKSEKFSFSHPDSAVIDERCPSANKVATKLARHIGRWGGGGIVIDYGYSNPNQRKDTLQALQKHQPVSPLASPGEADITAHVDFDRLCEVFTENQMECFGPVGQGAFLRRMGAELRTTALARNANSRQREQLLSGLERLVAPTQMGELFKVVAVQPPNLPPPEGFNK